jgi:hypothetical protein
MEEIRRRLKVSRAKSTYTRYSGMSNREFSEKDFNKDGKSDGLKKFKNALQELSMSIEKGSIGKEPQNLNKV